MKKLLTILALISIFSCTKEVTTKQNNPVYIKIQAVDLDNRITESGVIVVK